MDTVDIDTSGTGINSLSGFASCSTLFRQNFVLTTRGYENLAAAATPFVVAQPNSQFVATLVGFRPRPGMVPLSAQPSLKFLQRRSSATAAGGISLSL